MDTARSTSFRRLTRTDHWLGELELALFASLGNRPLAERPNPAASIADQELDESERRHAAGLMRINHAGEVCAQALYNGQAAVAKEPTTRRALLRAAQEEVDHLAWCNDRLAELGSRPSVLNPLWYGGSYLIGVAAGLYGDGYNLGFVVETERQVEAHLGEHLLTLPAGDRRSRAIVQQMQADEVAHGEAAKAAGARHLPDPIPGLMQAASKLMKAIAYRF
ncbi:2-polyprenyl-3-methyl-6-methoxy-1,4-benzoquinone monooxygenase [Pseudomarimonas arenosa]|uniref:3-demethoxyubiquinol 3-hydroxylase n=1 Tax=Pseudomarimonas arenosa TaxID=2774145 RepID=A0AAW3ZJ35_9GAMM|nr:2-polyprenyl-3-methyl-6-methoxy-1,4-benzoquinone monooxygenase [Pseudomarimonas arenosa]MBD8524950.1 2-polyprenyl-3-methyl-6-methoxy-1,4-benzoquinone monooxygenase [Pseudomarimonas arenosa]